MYHSECVAGSFGTTVVIALNPSLALLWLLFTLGINRHLLLSDHKWTALSTRAAADYYFHY